MSATGLEVFDKTLQTTNIWLNEIIDATGCDRQAAWKMLSAVLHQLRDRLPLPLGAHLAAQLPLLIRGIYYDQFEPERVPADCRRPEDFLEAVAEALQNRQVDVDEAVTAVFALLDRHLSDGLTAKIRASLPRAVAMLWNGSESRLLANAGA